ncbi:hypothetical protein B296_00027921 [Ensete ventricosum]|uniref:Uncharacterized protein n=1 Tax=Ensete ventricosum TaxID=4639 RepID=A0A427ANU9_ENSVE|nr:hypothetical protein B296_00027921 [Ensete ventricosum]
MVTGSLSELEQRRPRTVGGVLELDTNPIAAEPPQPLSVEVQLYLKDKRDGVSPGGEINSAAGRDDVVGLGGEELGDGAPPRLLLVVRARHLVLEIELHSSSLSRRLCYPVDLKGRSESGSSGAEQRQQEKKQNRVFGLTPVLFNADPSSLSLSRVVSSDGHPPHVRAPHERRRKGLRLLLICHKAAFASYLAMSSEAEHKEGVRRVLLP